MGEVSGLVYVLQERAAAAYVQPVIHVHIPTGNGLPGRKGFCPGRGAVLAWPRDGSDGYLKNDAAISRQAAREAARTAGNWDGLPKK